jgi:hypothetical protein
MPQALKCAETNTVHTSEANAVSRANVFDEEYGTGFFPSQVHQVPESFFLTLR